MKKICHFYLLPFTLHFISFWMYRSEETISYLSINAVGVAVGIPNEIKAQFPLNCSYLDYLSNCALCVLYFR